MTNDVIEVVMIGGKVRCVYLNDFRIVGSKPWADERQKIERFEVPAGEILKQLKRNHGGKDHE